MIVEEEEEVVADVVVVVVEDEKDLLATLMEELWVHQIRVVEIGSIVLNDNEREWDFQHQFLVVEKHVPAGVVRKMKHVPSGMDLELK